ncbi:MAG: hypothetical protein VB858_00255, partial [Planctomycetaceae bacterium]
MHFLNRLLQIRTILLAAMLMICSLSYGTEIQLGDDTLTRGIPGTGVLTENDIRGWLDQASSHEI